MPLLGTEASVISREMALAASSGRASHRPVIAVRKTDQSRPRASTTTRRDDH